MSKSIFPSDMLNSKELSLDSIKAKLNYFELQLHELHWQTTSHAEHTALGALYDRVFDMKDEIVEKLMGYTGVRTKAMPVDLIKNYASGLSMQIVSELKDFAYQIYEWAGEKHYCDVENLSQSLSGEAAKTLYLLTQS
jgi:DNA-binding ferritin-like protein